MLNILGRDGLMEKKKCYQCKRTKQIEDFHKNSARPDGRNTRCKECSSNYMKEDRKKYPDKYKRKKLNHRKKRLFYVWAQQTLYKHKKKGIKIGISIREVEETGITTRYCSLCGCKLMRNNGKGPKNNSPTLDRINNDNIINEDNIMVICHLCNKTKGERSLNEFIDYCKNIAKRQVKDGRLSADRDAYKGSTDTPQTAMMRTILTVEPHVL
jgi:hypothetical protein